MENWYPLGTIWHPFEGAGIYIYIGDEELPSYNIGITINNCKDPDWTTRIPWKVGGFFSRLNWNWEKWTRGTEGCYSAGNEGTPVIRTMDRINKKTLEALIPVKPKGVDMIQEERWAIFLVMFSNNNMVVCAFFFWKLVVNSTGLAVYPYKVGPLPVITGLITPITRVIRTDSHV